MKNWKKIIILTISLSSILLLTGCDKWNVMQGPNNKQIAADEKKAKEKKEKEKEKLEKIKVNPKELGSKDNSIVQEETDSNKHKNIGDDIEGNIEDQIKESFKKHNIDIENSFFSIHDEGNNVFKVEVRNGNVEASSGAELYKYNRLTKELLKQDIFSGGEYKLIE